MRAHRAVVAAARMSVLLVAAVPACAPAPTTSTTLTPLFVGWENYFRIASEAAQKGGRTVIRGTVYNTSTYRTKRIQLLIEGLDASGAVVNQRVAWLGAEVTPGDHAYFESPAPGPAASYRVRVFAFDPIRPT